MNKLQNYIYEKYQIGDHLILKIDDSFIDIYLSRYNYKIGEKFIIMNRDIINDNYIYYTLNTKNSIFKIKINTRNKKDINEFENIFILEDYFLRYIRKKKLNELSNR